MRFCLFGDTGSGKTLTAIYFIMHYYFKGFKIFSNIHLKNIKYTLIKDSHDFKNLGFGDKNLVFIDELGATTTSRNYHAINLQHVLAQSRKMIGENSHMIFTAQTTQQASSLVMSFIDLIAYPTLIREPDGNKPLWVELECYNKIPNTRGYVQAEDLIIENIFEATKYYDTDEQADTFKDGTLLSLKDDYKEFIGSEKTLALLTDKIVYEKGKGKSEAKSLARAIIYDLG